jgi:hypothetical protein
MIGKGLELKQTKPEAQKHMPSKEANQSKTAGRYTMMLWPLAATSTDHCLPIHLRGVCSNKIPFRGCHTALISV